MINTDKNIPTDKYAADSLFEVSDEEILETVLSAEVIENAESARERVFEQIAERIGIESVPQEYIPFYLSGNGVLLKDIM